MNEVISEIKIKLNNSLDQRTLQLNKQQGRIEYQKENYFDINLKSFQNSIFLLSNNYHDVNRDQAN